MMMFKFAANQSYSKTKYKGGHERLTRKGAGGMAGAGLGVSGQDKVPPIMCCLFAEKMIE
jgi:hypothetical protein